MIGSLTLSGDHGRLWKQLERERTLTKEQFKDSVRRAKQEDRHLVEVLFSTSNGSTERLLEIFSEYFELPAVRLRDKVISPYILNLIPKDVARAHSVIVFKKIKEVVHVATTTPDHQQVIDFVRTKTGLEPKVFLTTPDDVEHALKIYPTEITTEFAKIIEDSMRETVGTTDSAETLAQHLPIVMMVNSVIERALAQNASDIHIEPGADIVTIRYRIDGLLRRIVELPAALLPPIAARLKLMAKVKIDEHRAPQDGRINYVYQERDVAIRVSIVPTLHGSKFVLRLLDTKRQQFTLRGLGLNSLDHDRLKKAISQPNGMILVTGPTGSGKTTTLYTLLGLLNTEEKNICTIEDPIEYGLPGVNQTQINPAAKLTFASGLRSLLRQDPNVIMVGEIRDADTADIAVNAAMTGHLVLSTLHTNSAAQSFQRFIEMGVPAYLTASTVNLIVAQRLVRKICRHCLTESRLTERQIAAHGPTLNLSQILDKLIRHKLLPDDATLSNLNIASSKGCAKCQDTGYLGRVGIYEMIPNNQSMHEVVLRDPTPAAITAETARQDRLNMIDDGVLKVLSGLTSFEEVLRVTK